ncbi:conserved hypothetical protein [Vibrio harveyi]|uniref:hypothetical protein n=1 Tax=Vibrio harveyi TaxID=669 RepID=UPI001EFCA9EC|nr:hypothetical protein [Vibrio harveyi]MCG9236246.1 hypothetical protein [Vibrio harveyi]MCG9584870.1 hypothetical protein [Vibrio harveyi]CAH1217848.1 conserved hypothetical protein [Vibrio harveyi]CAH1552439.1 conserved hypothetical protein [Vibrio harveyi]CAH1558621.1 conserved hypothetical protein [Vibrio harveyi]
MDASILETKPLEQINRLVQAISIGVPLQRVDLDLDVSSKVALPALQETSLLLVSQLDAISPIELAGYFNLNSHEIEVLVSELIRTDLVKFNDEGDLVETLQLSTIKRQNSGELGIAIEEVVNHNESTYIDLVTGFIQPRSESNIQRGLPTIERKINEKDFSEYITKQFRRFQACLPHSKYELKSDSTRLYRVNHALAAGSLLQIVSLNIKATSDPLMGISLESDVIDYNADNMLLLEQSGLPQVVHNWLATREHDPYTVSGQDYCDIARDNVLGKYIDHTNTLDLKQLLIDRVRKKTGYGEARETNMLIGPIYTPSNRQIIEQWLIRRSVKERMSQGIWLGATNELFGASLGFSNFIADINKQLQEGDRNSALNLCYRKSPKNIGRELQGRFNTRTNGQLHTFDYGTSDSHMEILVFPGERGCALIQFHAKVSNEFGFKGLTIPVGYFTTNSERVAYLWKVVQNRIQSNELRRFKSDKSELTEPLNTQLSVSHQLMDDYLKGLDEAKARG